MELDEPIHKQNREDVCEPALRCHRSYMELMIGVEVVAMMRCIRRKRIREFCILSQGTNLSEVPRKHENKGISGNRLLKNRSMWNGTVRSATLGFWGGRLPLAKYPIYRYHPYTSNICLRTLRCLRNGCLSIPYFSLTLESCSRGCVDFAARTVVVEVRINLNQI